MRSCRAGTNTGRPGNWTCMHRGAFAWDPVAVHAAAPRFGPLLRCLFGARHAYDVRHRVYAQRWCWALPVQHEERETSGSLCAPFVAYSGVVFSNRSCFGLPPQFPSDPPRFETLEFTSHQDFGCESHRLWAPADSWPAPCEREDGSVSYLRRCGSFETTMTIGVGTHNYMAPEVVRTKHYNEKVDIYSFSLIMFYLSSGKRPFYHLGCSPTEILDRFAAGEEPRPDADECHKVLRALMQQCWSVNPNHRPSADEVLQSLKGMNAAQCGCSTMWWEHEPISGLQRPFWQWEVESP